MNKADGREMADRFSAIVTNSIDTQTKTQDLARQAYQSRTQFHRLFRAAVEETPAAMRRRLLLERAAYQLGHSGMPVTDVALDANYGSLEAFTRAFRKAFPDLSQHLSAHARFAFSFASAEQDSLFCGWFANRWFINKRRKRHGSIRSFCKATTPGTRGVCWSTRVL